MPKLVHIDSLEDIQDHVYDVYTELGYKYERNIMKNVVSPEMFNNPIHDAPIRQIERLIENLVNQVKNIKLHFAFALPKHSKLLN